MIYVIKGCFANACEEIKLERKHANYLLAGGIG
jgi:hypothetical protein